MAAPGQDINVPAVISLATAPINTPVIGNPRTLEDVSNVVLFAHKAKKIKIADPQAITDDDMAAIAIQEMQVRSVVLLFFTIFEH